MAELAIHCADGLSLEGLIKLAIRNADCEDYLTCDNKNESLESLLKRAFSIGDDGTYALNVCGCSGGVEPVGGLTEVTYAELIALIGSSGLTPGGFYLLTDFATKHYFTDWTSTLADINTGATEPLILFATSTDNIDSRVYSPSYPQDIIHYDWDSSNWLTDISFSSDRVNIVTGWKGIITYRKDTDQDNSCGYDFRNVKFRRWALNPSLYNAGTTYAKKAVVYVGSKIYKSLHAGNIGNTPTNDGPDWVAVVDLTNTKYWAWGTGNCNGIPTDANDFIDVYTFNGVYENNVTNNHISINHDNFNTADLNLTRLNNIVFQIFNYGWRSTYGNNFKYGAYWSTIDIKFQDNSIEDMFNQNLIGAQSSFNLIGFSFSENTIYNLFSLNKCSGVIGGNDFGTGFSTNVVKNSIAGSMFGARNDANEFCDVIVCVTSDDFTQNMFKMNITGLDFLSASHVYGNYTCTIQLREDGTARLSYINNSDVLTIVAATA